MDLKRAEKLAKEHWDYLSDALATHGVGENIRMVVGFHYKTAFIHGYKHALEDVQQLFNEDYKELYTDLLEECYGEKNRATKANKK